MVSSAISSILINLILFSYQIHSQQQETEFPIGVFSGALANDDISALLNS
jgi:hypothetical protein